MHIAIINSFYYPAKIGGAERSVQILAESMVNRGHRVSVLCTALDGREKDTELNGVALSYRPQSNVYNWTGADKSRLLSSLKPCWHALDSWNPFSYRQTRDWLTALAPDVLHTNNLSGFSVSCWRAARRLKIPVVHTIRDYYLMCFKGVRWKKDSVCQSSCRSCKIFSLPKLKSSSSPRAVVGISQDVLSRHLSAGYFSSTTIRQVIGNPVKTVNTGVYQNNEDRGPLRVGFLGRIESAKGVEVLLREFTQLPTAEYQLRLYGRGDPGYLRRLRTLYPAANIEFLDHETPEKIFADTDITVVPSLWDEPFGRVVIESYSYGRPVITSGKGGLAELIAPGSGYSFLPANPGELAGILSTLTRAKCRNLRSRCLQEAKRFSEGTIAMSYEALFQEII